MSEDIICFYCQNIFIKTHFNHKYCSQFCSKKFHSVKEMNRRKTDVEYRQKRNQKEIKRRHLKRQLDSSEREKHNFSEKVRYRKKNNILSDKDLKKNPKGSGCLTKFGYRKIAKKGHPNAWRTGEMLEHVFIMSEHLGRPIRKGETIHHKNGIKHDNRIENLELWNNSHPHGQRVKDKIKFYKEFLDLYGYNVIKK